MLKNFQKQVDEWIGQFKEGYWKPAEIIMSLTEELGELAREVNHRFGPKKKKSIEEKKEIAYYNLDKKAHQSRKFKQLVEILNIVGNVAAADEELVIHAHGIFGKKNMKTFGGHINSLIVGPTLELYFKKLDGELRREFFKDIGLKLLLCHKQ